jgi:hypothetical protein
MHGNTIKIKKTMSYILLSKHINTLWGQTVVWLFVRAGGAWSNRWAVQGLINLRILYFTFRKDIIWKPALGVVFVNACIIVRKVFCTDSFNLLVTRVVLGGTSRMRSKRQILPGRLCKTPSSFASIKSGNAVLSRYESFSAVWNLRSQSTELQVTSLVFGSCGGRGQR